MHGALESVAVLRRLISCRYIIIIIIIIIIILYYILFYYIILYYIILYYMILYYNDKDLLDSWLCSATSRPRCHYVSVLFARRRVRRQSAQSVAASCTRRVETVTVARNHVATTSRSSSVRCAVRRATTTV